MTKRYFYSDPLAAAWMAKHHEMTLYIGHLPDDYDAYSAVNWWHAIDDERFRREKFKQQDIRFFIHPDSLHLLEPRDLDVLEYPDGGYFQVVGFNIGMEKAKGKIDVGAKLIKRNGIAFIWPETAPSEPPQPNPGE